MEESFYAQHQLEALNINNTILEEMKECGSQMTELELRSLLGCFLFSGDDVEKKIKYTNGDITVVWKPELCKHSGRCVTQLPKVFNLKTKPWVTMTGADSEAIKAQVNKCPTGALSWILNEESSKP